MRLDPEILCLLRCPLSGTPLVPVDDAQVDRLNRQIAAKQVCNRCGEALLEPIEAALTNAAGDWLVPIRGGVVTLIADQLIARSEIGSDRK